MSSFEKDNVMFLVGRMNPPTPGHIKGLCVPFLKVIREKCLEILKLPQDDQTQLFILTKKASVAPRFFLTNSTNEKRISYLSGSKAELYDNVNQIVKDKPSSQEMSEGIFYVKDKQLENPLETEQKKRYVVDMLGNELLLPENKEIMVPKSVLNNWIVCQTVGYESWCASYGPASAIKCALMLSKPKKYDKVFFFMGVDEDPKEMQRRSKFCQNSDVENDEGAKVNCVMLDRINTATIQEDDDDSSAIKATEAIADGSMSASKIRLLCANEDIETVQALYKDLLTPQQVLGLINNVRIGLRMSPIKDVTQIEPIPSVQRKSGRIMGSMPGPALIDDTYQANRSGWRGFQSIPGINAVGETGISNVRNAERSAKLATIVEGSPEEEKEGGRKTRRNRNKRIKNKTRVRHRKSKTTRKRKPSRKRKPKTTRKRKPKNTRKNKNTRRRKSKR
jgi:hypothetical protein